MEPLGNRRQALFPAKCFGLPLTGPKGACERANLGRRLPPL